jgi:hypothetical protein
VYTTGTQDYTGLTFTVDSTDTHLVLGQGFFADFNYSSSYTLSPNSWAGIALFSEVASNNPAWEPQGSYFLSETAYVTPSDDNVGAVNSITVTDGGSGYTSVPTVDFTGGGGRGATADAVLSGTTVESITVTKSGSAYTSEPTVTFTGGGEGSGATATAVLSGTTVGSITVTDPGSGYTSVPAVDFTGGGGRGATADAVLSGTTVESITVTDGGSGYTSVPTVDFAGGGEGSGAEADATVSDDSQRVDSRLSRITSGSLYSFYVGGSSKTNLTVDATVNSKPISFGNSQTLATTAAANTDEANIAYIIRRAYQNTEIAPFRYSKGAITSGQVGSVTVTNSGSGYTSEPTVTFTGGGEGSGATATAVLSGTTVGSITVTDPGSGYTSVPAVDFTGGGGRGAEADASLIGNLQNIMMASEGATDKNNYKYDITPQKAVVSRSIGDQYTFNYPARTYSIFSSVTGLVGGGGYSSVPTVTFTGGGGSGASATAVLSGTTVGSITVNNPGSGYTSAPTMTISAGTTGTATATAVLADEQETYDFATGGDGVVAIGATDSFASVSKDGASKFTFLNQKKGAFDWPLTSKIIVSDAGFLYTDDLTKIFKSRSYGHSYNMALGLNFDLGTGDGNDINLATNWSYSDFFRGDSVNRYAKAALTNGKSGWKIQPTFDMSGLTEKFPVSSINEKAAAAFVNIKNLFAIRNEPAVWIASLVGLCNDKNHPTPANASALTDWESIPFSAPVGGDPAAALITTANFKDYSDVDEKDDLLTEFGLDATCLSTERSLGTTASYIKGDSHSIWKNKTGTSSVETKFPASGGSDGEWGYWESSNFDKIVSYSQTGTVKATTSSTTKVSSDVIKKEMTNTAHAIDFGYTYVPQISLGINLKGVTTTFGHTPPTKVDIDFGEWRTEMTVALNKNAIKFSSIVNGTKLKVEQTKTTVEGVKWITHISPLHNCLAGGVEARSKVVGAAVTVKGVDLTSKLLRCAYTLAKANSRAAELNSAAAQVGSRSSVSAAGVQGNAEATSSDSSGTDSSAETDRHTIRGGADTKTKENAAANPGDEEASVDKSKSQDQTNAAATGPVNRAGKPLDAMHIARLKRFDPTFTP